jgi:hypothetical protein
MRFCTTIAGFIAGFMLLASSGVSSAAQEDGATQKLYLGFASPGTTREVFAPGIVSTGASESGLAISPDGREIVYSVTVSSVRAILHVTWDGRRWSTPQVVPFSGHYNDWEPVFSPDGVRLYFVSLRPTGRPAVMESDGNLWYVERSAAGWGQPIEVGPPVNTPRFYEGYGSVTNKGTLYFFRYSNDAENLSEIFRSERGHNGHAVPELLGPAINSPYHDWDPFIAPDESYLIFSSQDRPDSFGKADLYISFRTTDGAWSEAVNMGPGVNTSGWEICPFVSADGRYLFFEAVTLRETSTPRHTVERPPAGTAVTYDWLLEMVDLMGESSLESYWVDARIIDELRQVVLGS